MSAGPAASADVRPSGTQKTLPPDAGSGKAPHAETGMGTGQSNVQKPAGQRQSEADHGAAPSKGSQTSGKKPGHSGPGLTDEGNQGAREQRLGEKPAP
ncbi:MAG: hypothetical protein IPK78_10650 [Rhodospirillales bacterium]|nr:hypothetical protein [Rhodospirillales bacterium]